MTSSTKRSWVNSLEKLTAGDNLAEPFLNSVTKKENFKIGIEVEQFLVQQNSHKALSYNSQDNEPSISKILSEFSKNFGWEAILEEGNIVALKKDAFTITLEPGGALEFVTPPYKSTGEVEEALDLFEQDFKSVLKNCGASSLRLGYLPFDKVETVGLVPKSRYDYMYNYMPEVGARGREMMKLTSSIQLSIDYQSEADCIRKMKLAAQATPIFIALSANSRVKDGKFTENLSERSAVWEDTDSSRCGLLDFQFNEKSTFADYVNWALRTPVYFIVRDGKQISLSGINFQEFLDGEFTFKEDISHPYPTLSDWEQHISTLFPWVRLRHYIEIRSFDMGPKELQIASTALVKGLFNCNASLSMLESLLVDLDFSKTTELTKLARQKGLEAEYENINLKALSLKANEISKECLIRSKKGEEKYLEYFFDKIKNWDYKKEKSKENTSQYVSSNIFR